MTPTPGPWRAVGGAIRPMTAKGYTGGYAPILSAHHDKRLPDNREANAKLAADEWVGQVDGLGVDAEGMPERFDAERRLGVVRGRRRGFLGRAHGMKIS